MGVRFLPDRSPFLRGPTATDSDAALWAAAVVTNGGTVSATRLSQVSAVVAAWKAPGTWDLIDDCWWLVAENAPQALTSFKQRRLATAVAAPTFTIDRGYAFNGTTQYLDTGFIPSTHKVAMTGSNLHLAVYERTNLAADAYAAGAYTSSNQSFVLAPRRSAGQMQAFLNAAANGPGGDVLSDSRGLSVASRNGTLVTDVKAYRNGVAIVPYAVTTIASVLVATRVFIGARSDPSNLPLQFRAATEGFVSVGADIPAAQQPAFYAAIQNFMTAVGANV